MVEPSGRIAIFFTLRLVRATGALIVSCAPPKLYGRKLGKVVKESLPKDARLPCMADDKTAMVTNGV
jgi:hypothetical protein